MTVSPQSIQRLIKKVTLFFFCVTALATTQVNLNKILVREGQICQALFTPHDNIKEILITLIDAEQKEIRAAAYFFTDSSIAQAFTRAHERKVKIKIITDYSSLENTRYTKIWKLFNNGIKIYVYGQKDRPENGIMHNKFLIFSENFSKTPIVVTGSFNYTYSAQAKNRENVLIVNNTFIIQKYCKYFNSLKAECQDIKNFSYLNPSKKTALFGFHNSAILLSKIHNFIFTNA